MKIAFFIPAWPPGSTPNGIVTYYGNLIVELREIGHEIFIVAGRETSCEPNLYVTRLEDALAPLENLTTRFIDIFAPGYWIYRAGAKAIIKSLSQILENNKIDILQMEDSRGWCSLVSDAINIPVVVRLHGPHFLNGTIETNNKLTRKIRNRIKREGRAFSRAKYITAPSQNVLDETRAYYDIDWHLSKVIPTATSPVPENQQWTLNCCNRNEVLFIGRFDKHKGGDLIVDAFTKLVAQYHDASLSFVGPDLGVKENNRMLSLDEYLDKNVPDSIRSKITYLGQLSRREVDELRPKAYMTVVSSRYENFGNVVLEAMAFGCPLVATSVGGTAEIVRDGYDGLLSAPNADALANQMKMIFEDTELAERISKQAVLSISNRFNPNKQARQTADFFREVLQK